MTPPDKDRCQAEKPNGDSFMTLGGRYGGRVRCTSKPTMIITEVKPPPGQTELGSMSLCDECKAVFDKQEGFEVTVEKLP